MHMNTRMTLAALIVILFLTATAPAAVIVDVGWHKNTATGFETEGAALLQDIVDSGFDFDSTVSSPDEIAISDFIGDNAIFSVFMIEMIEGTSEGPLALSLSNLFVDYDSDDSGDTFDLSDNYGDANYDSALIRGWDSGGEVADGTAGSIPVTRILGYGIGVNFDDTPTNADYFRNELHFDVTAWYAVVDFFGTTLPGGVGSSQTTVAEVPEPATLALATVGLAYLVFTRRRQ